MDVYNVQLPLSVFILLNDTIYLSNRICICKIGNFCDTHTHTTKNTKNFILRIVSNDRARYIFKWKMESKKTQKL